MNRLLVLLLIAGSLRGQQPPGNSPDAVGFDRVIQALLSEFDRTDIVALSDTHGDNLGSELRIRLIRHPQFARKVHFVLVEFASTAQQAILDRYIAGEQLRADQLAAIWGTTTQTNGIWDSPVYAEFFRAVRDVNAALPGDSKIRVLAGDPPSGSTIDRDVSAIDVLKEQVLAAHSKALVIYGGAHIFRWVPPGQTGITAWLERESATRFFVVMTQGGTDPRYRQFDAALKTAVRPVLVSLQESPFRELRADVFLGDFMKKLVNGQWVSVFEDTDVTLGAMADACVYFGNIPRN